MTETLKDFDSVKKIGLIEDKYDYGVSEDDRGLILVKQSPEFIVQQLINHVNNHVVFWKTPSWRF